MQPILSIAQTQAADANTIAQEPIKSIDLMERASQAFCNRFMEIYDESSIVHIFCGPGNNGGDGLAIGRILDSKGFMVFPYVFQSSSSSKEFNTNYSRLASMMDVQIVTDDVDLEFSSGIIIDAIFGSGLSRPLEGIYEETVLQINKSKLEIVAVDMPSGLLADSHTTSTSIHSDLTMTFQYPKMSMLLPGYASIIGHLEILDIGLKLNQDMQESAGQYCIEDKDISSMFRSRPKFSHKGTFGHLLLAGGSYGKMGAIVLAAKSAMRSGLGLLTTYVPATGNDIMQTSFPESMTIVDSKGDQSLTSFSIKETYDAIAVGPGLGSTPSSLKFLTELLATQPSKMVIDADALNLLSENKELLSELPKESILTPHPGEFKRLVGEWKDDFHKIELLKEFCHHFGVIVVLKGSHTITCKPDGILYVNTTGNPGMATAGSGDTLTGIIGAFLAKGYPPIDAAIIGVYLHGLSGDIAVQIVGPESLIASDLIASLPEAIQYIEL